MSHSYSTTPPLVTLTLPDDGDPEVAASVNVPFQQIANASISNSYGLKTQTFTGSVTAFALPSNALAIVMLQGCGGGGGGAGGQNGPIGTDSYPCSGGGGGGATLGTA